MAARPAGRCEHTSSQLVKSLGQQRPQGRIATPSVERSKTVLSVRLGAAPKQADFSDFLREEKVENRFRMYHETLLGTAKEEVCLISIKPT